ncbi:Dephospho-CoA kinase [Desulfonema limicola]|uniref:Dephospho-CoA kinase n=1 Tax=Desulfonema limicola TaxID=45656 RepID=A0A975B691_9BACT|nr:dephospho-CoA kinase [Desulfonema limicola]QTA79563.1 Dephospho-CoA kinase [Desulfonema limicola]
MIIAGLTGGIASGKSTVSGFFKDAGAFIIDADKIAHALVKKDRPAWQKIVKYFGKDVLLPDGEINREFLGNIIFNNPEEKQKLNNIVHPLVFMEMEKQVKKIKKNTRDAVIIQDIPLLFEAGYHKDISPVILVYVPEYTQLQRLMKRNNLSESDAKSRIYSQIPIEEKKILADIIIDNSKTIADTGEKTLGVYNYLTQTADNK